jgi:hypothetical protein
MLMMMMRTCTDSCEYIGLAVSMKGLTMPSKEQGNKQQGDFVMTYPAKGSLQEDA